MARMIDLIREAAVPANLMRSAARGALSLPAPAAHWPSELGEILALDTVRVVRDNAVHIA